MYDLDTGLLSAILREIECTEEKWDIKGTLLQTKGAGRTSKHIDRTLTPFSQSSLQSKLLHTFWPPSPIVSISTLTTIFWSPCKRRVSSITAGLDRSNIVPMTLLLGLCSPALNWSKVVVQVLVGTRIHISNLLRQRLEIRPSRPFSSHVEVGLRIRDLGVLGGETTLAGQLNRG